MNTQQIQFNHRWGAALLLTGLILALATGLAWTQVNASSSTFQPAKMGQTGLSAAVDCPEADFWGGESGLRPWFHFRSIRGSKPGGTTDGVSSKDCESGLWPWSHLRFIAGRKPGASGGSGATA